MDNNILVINAGSSSLKYQLIDMNTENTIAKGMLDRIGLPGAEAANHAEALKSVLKTLTDKETGVIKNLNEIRAVGHRVLHGGEDFKKTVLITDAVMKKCRKNEPLGPLHMPPNLNCIDACREILPEVPMAAVFDTAFHANMPDYAFMYGLPYQAYEEWHLRKYGFHGTSHKFVSGEAIKFLEQLGGTNNAAGRIRIITCHLGGGSSIAAVKNGKCIDTSMGLTPLEGLIMGTRSGDIDPACIEVIMEKTGMDIRQTMDYLNKKSGMLGISEQTSDFRDLHTAMDKGDKRAELAINMFAYRIKKYVGSYAAALKGCDCIVMTGGIGENVAMLRDKVLSGLEYMGVKLDSAKNDAVRRGKIYEIQADDSLVKLLVVPTNEELVIARETLEVI